MAISVLHNLPLVLTCFVTLILLEDQTICSPIKRSTNDDCYGTECEIDLDDHDNTHEHLENITNLLVPALPEIIHQLQNIAYINQNTSTTAFSSLPSIVNFLEEQKNQLAAQSSGSVTQNLAELVSLIQSQQDLQERQNHLLENTSATLQQMTHLLQDQVDKQNQLLEKLTPFPLHPPPTSMHHSTASMHPSTTSMAQIHQETSHQLTTTSTLQPQALQLHGCSNGLSSGSYLISPPNDELGSFHVYCDMDTAGGRWIIFQRRFNGSVNFDRNWIDYENGFGSLSGEFWLGLSKLHVLTNRGRWELRVDVEDFQGDHAYANYDNFEIGSNSSFYRLTIGSYSGTARDSMTSYDLNGMAFTTKDQDHDLYWTNCATLYRSGWWHKGCTLANNNGLYLGEEDDSCTGMYWYYWKRSCKGIKKSEMKIRLVEGLQ